MEHSPQDWISQLPDEILVLILSFLTLKEAAQTSVLSSRWMTLWTHTLRLDFDAASTLGRILYNPKTLRSERRKYVAWVNHVLHSHKGSTLDEFRVCFDLGKAFQNSIDEWLEYAFAKRVKRLELDLSLYAGNVGHPSGSCNFPSRLLNPVYWTSLGQINSYLPRINHNLLTDFISLKELSLKCVNVTDEVIKFILLKCLFLERLVVLGSGLLVNLVVSCPSLMLLEIKYCTSLESITICNSNLVTLKISHVGKLIITNTPMLAEVHIEGGFPDFPLYVFSQLSCCLSQLEFLMLDTDRPEKIARLRSFPELSELKELVINVAAWGDDSLIGFTSFLQSCPNLQKFVLQLWWINPTKTDRECEKAMKCSLKYLKEIELSGYYGRTSELELITFFLDNAIALEKIIIDPRVQSCLHKPLIDCDQEQAGRLCATQQLEGLVPSHIELVIT